MISGSFCDWARFSMKVVEVDVVVALRMEGVGDAGGRGMLDGSEVEGLEELPSGTSS